MKNDLLEVLRQMAYERAKGEINSIFRSVNVNQDLTKMDKFQDLANEFFDKVENENLLN